MTILVTGSTGTVGSHLLKHLSAQGNNVRALTRDPSRATFPTGITPVTGDMLDIESMRKALANVSTLFLLNAVTSEELSQSLLTLNLAREAGVKGVVYLSVFNGEAFCNVPHFVTKHVVEQMIEAYDMPATILRANCYMQNDATSFKEALLGPGLYPFPIGDKGVSMVDTRDLAEIAANALIQRERADSPLPRQIVNAVGPECLTGTGNAAIWSDLLGKPIRYTGDDTAPFEKSLGQHVPSWMAMDLRLMLERFQQNGMRGTPHDVEEMTRLLGRPPRSYRAFAKESVAEWRA